MEHPFRLMTAQSRAGDAGTAVDQIAASFDMASRGRPDFIAVHFGVGLPAEALRAAVVAQCAGAAVHGGTSCLGIMSQDGVNIDTGAGIGALAIWDATGSYGTASADLGHDAEATARATALAAVTAAGRSGEIPDFVWLTVAPGREEQVLAGLRAVFGAQTPIFGGSSADNDVTGQWAQFGPEAVHVDGLVVSALFPSTPIGTAYQSGYAPTGSSGVVTKVEGRRLIEIDNRPAAEVYHKWTSGAVPQADDAPLSILQASTLWPLGRVTRQVAGVPFHLLAHPAAAQPGGALDLFADVAAGDRLWQMQGSADSLVARAGRVAARARSEVRGDIAGALVIYCGGCMLSVRDRMQEVRNGIDTALGGVPWLGVFTFGEQGGPLGETSLHGNLMISCTVFGR